MEVSDDLRERERERGTRLCFPVLIEDLALNIDWDTRKELGFAMARVIMMIINKIMSY
jgi:hypothetical protein